MGRETKVDMMTARIGIGEAVLCHFFPWTL